MRCASGRAPQGLTLLLQGPPAFLVELLAERGVLTFNAPRIRRTGASVREDLAPLAPSECFTTARGSRHRNR